MNITVAVIIVTLTALAILYVLWRGFMDMETEDQRMVGWVLLSISLLALVIWALGTVVDHFLTK